MDFILSYAIIFYAGNVGNKTMKTITKIIENDRIPYYGQQLLHTPSLLFDIETTGFSPETTSLYLISLFRVSFLRKIRVKNLLF